MVTDSLQLFMHPNELKAFGYQEGEVVSTAYGSAVVRENRPIPLDVRGEVSAHFPDHNHKIRHVMLEPGWLERTCHDAHIRCMVNHAPQFFEHLKLRDKVPISAADAAEVYAAMDERFAAWTGLSFLQFEGRDS